MPQFRYQARNTQGELIQDMVEAENLNHAATLISLQGLIPIDITAHSYYSFNWRVIFNVNLFQKNLSKSDLSIFCRQMYALYKAGIPLTQALTRLKEVARFIPFKNALDTIQKDIEAGNPLAQALQKHPQFFSSLFCNFIAVGESTGQLEQSFYQLMQFYDLEDHTIKQLKNVSRYPLIVISAILLALVIINMLVIPAFEQFFTSYKQSLPWATLLLLSFSKFMVKYWPYLLLGLLLAIGLIRCYFHTQKGRYLLHKKQLSFPIIGPIVTQILYARFARTLAMIFRTDIPIHRGLDLVAEASGNDYLQDKIKGMRQQVERGENLVNALRETHLFSNLVIQMFTVGEETGDFESMLTQIAEFYEEEITYNLKRLQDLLEPILLVFVAGLVLMLALGVFLPMWDMVNLIKH